MSEILYKCWTHDFVEASFFIISFVIRHCLKCFEEMLFKNVTTTGFTWIHGMANYWETRKKQTQNIVNESVGNARSSIQGCGIVSKGKEMLVDD